jgi:soluble lytic murein transglycosylase-like protein
MMKVESNYNPWARSPKGALGLMQLIPATGARFGVRNFYDPQENIEGGVRYLKFLLQKFEGNVDLSLAAYNAGENLVERLGRVPAIPETRDYVRKIKSIYGKGYAPVTRSALAPAAPGATTPVADAVAPVDNTIFKSMDQRGVIHFSNIGPPN